MTDIELKKYKSIANTTKKYYAQKRFGGYDLKDFDFYNIDMFISAYRATKAAHPGSHNIPRQMVNDLIKVKSAQAKVIANAFSDIEKEIGAERMNLDNKFGPEVEQLDDIRNKDGTINKTMLEKLIRKKSSFKDMLFQMGDKNDPRMYRKQAYKDQSKGVDNPNATYENGTYYYYVPIWITSPD